MPKGGRGKGLDPRSAAGFPSLSAEDLSERQHGDRRKYAGAVAVLEAVGAVPCLDLMATLADRTVTTAEASTRWPEGVRRLAAADLVQVRDVVVFTRLGRQVWYGIRSFVV